MKQEKITERQREFARLIAKGEKQGAAYRRAFDCTGQSEAAVRSNASRLAKNDNILRLIEELRKRADGEVVIKRYERMVRLSQIVRRAGKKGSNVSIRNGLRAIQELNRMDGAYAPQKAHVDTTMSIANIVKTLQGRGCQP